MSINYQNQPKTYAIIIGLDSIQGLQTARILSKRNVPVIGIAKNPDHYGCKTKVCAEVLFADTSNEDVIRELGNLGTKLKTKSVLFPCQDKNVLLVSQHRQFLEKWYHIVLPIEEVVEMMLDKAAFYTYAQEFGFPIPPTFILNSRRDAEKAAKKLDFPCILKPSWRPETWTNHTKSKAFFINSEKELLDLYDHYHGWAEVLIVQEWISGDESNHYTCNCYFGSNGEPLVTFTTRKMRQWPSRTGQACLSEEYHSEEVLRETIRLFESVPYHGLGYLEMKRDECSGKLLIVEPNVGRPTGRAATAEASGVELIFTMYCDAVGLPLPSNIEQQYNGVKWIHLLRDLQSAFYYWRKGELSFNEWWRSLRGHKTYALLSWSDPAPFMFALLRVLPTLLSPRERGKEDY